MTEIDSSDEWREAWGEDPVPIPLTRSVQVPTFPMDALPTSIADMVRAVAEATQTDPAMPATSALSALSGCTGGHAEIEIRPGWREPLNLYIATVAAPGERKSSVQRTMVRPLISTERELIKSTAAERQEAQTRKDVAAKNAELQRNNAAKAEKDDQDAALADAIGAVALADSITVPPVPRLIVDDITPEKVAELLAEQGGRLALISAEGGVFDIIAGRYSRQPNLDVWLKGHAGDDLRVDRKSGPPQYISRPALTLGLMIQPAVLDAIAAHREFRGRGLLARFLYSWPRPKVGYREIATAPVPEEVRAAYEATVGDLLTGMVKWNGDPAVLTLSAAAHEAMVEIETTIEPTLAGNGELAALADWGAKYAGAIARIAGILHLAELGEVGTRSAVEAQSIVDAYRIGEFFKASAINAFAEMGTDDGTADAVYLLDRIKGLGADDVSERDLLNACQSRFKTMDALRPAIARLVDHGHLTPLAKPESTGGRPPSQRYRVQAKGAKGAKG